MFNDGVIATKSQYNMAIEKLSGRAVTCFCTEQQKSQQRHMKTAREETVPWRWSLLNKIYNNIS